jgi:hypothetical protein
MYTMVSKKIHFVREKTRAKQIIIALGGGEGNTNNKNIGFIEIDKPDNEMLFEIYGSKYILREMDFIGDKNKSSDMDNLKYIQLMQY